MALPLLSLPVTQPMPKPATHSTRHVESRWLNHPQISPEPLEAAQALPVASPEPTPQIVTPTPQPAAYGPTDHQQLMSAAGISSGDYSAAEYIVAKESGWNAEATNPGSGAHGLPQALPYSKTGCLWADSICQLKWADGYAKARYGGWANAYTFWLANHYW